MKRFLVLLAALMIGGAFVLWFGFWPVALLVGGLALWSWAAYRGMP